MFKIRKRLRFLPKPVKLTPYEKRDRNNAAIIAKHPQIRLIIGWLKEGISIPEIARHLALDGLISQTERTFTDYLQSYKRVYSKKLERQEGIYGDTTASLDKLVSAHQPSVDIVRELNRMYRVQKVRVAIGLRNELVTGKLNKEQYRELNTAQGYLEMLARIEGRLDKDAPDDGLEKYPLEVQQAIRNIKEDERAMEHIRLLTADFIRRCGPSAAKHGVSKVSTETARLDKGGYTP